MATVFRRYHARGAFYPYFMGVIRNQRPRIHRFRLVSTVSNIDCRVI